MDNLSGRFNSRRPAPTSSYIVQGVSFSYRLSCRQTPFCQRVRRRHVSHVSWEWVEGACPGTQQVAPTCGVGRSRDSPLPNSPPTSESFPKFYKDHYDAVFYWFRRRGLQPETSRDLTQETFMAAYKGFSDFRNESSHKTWVIRIARNRFRNHLRDNAALKRKHEEAHRVETRDGELEPLEIEDTKAPTPEDKALEREESEALRRALHAFPTQMRQCLELRLADMKYREIAEVMDISVETVKSHLYQARQRLRKNLSDGEGQ
ncbi:MAG: RNA polymerase sigma factor [Acidobacteriota bacterium]